MNSNSSLTLARQLWTPNFAGDNKVLAALAPIGHLISMLISVVCLVALWIKIAEIMLTVLVRAVPQFFEKVHNYQRDVADSSGYMGIGRATPKKLFGGQTKVGITNILAFALLLIPDVVAMTPYAEENIGKGINKSLTQEDTVVDYLIKSFIPNTAIILILAMAYQGYIWMFMGQVVEGLGVFGQKIAYMNTAGWIESRLNASENYSFNALGMSGKPLDELRENVATDIYNQIIRDTKIHEQSDVYKTGQELAGQVKSTFSDQAILNAAQANYGPKLNADDYDAIKYQIGYDTTAQQPGAVNLALKTNKGPVTQAGSQVYAHVFFPVKSPFSFFKYKSGDNKSTDPNDSTVYVPAF